MPEPSRVRWTHALRAPWWRVFRGAVEACTNAPRFLHLLTARLGARLVVICSREMEIRAAQEQMERLSMSRPVLIKPPPAIDPGLLPLTEAQLETFAKAMAAGSGAEVLAADSFKGVLRGHCVVS